LNSNQNSFGNKDNIEEEFGNAFGKPATTSAVNNDEADFDNAFGNALN